MATTFTALDRFNLLRPDRPVSCSHDHHVQFYEDDAYLTDVVTRFAEAGFHAGERVLLLVTQAHRDALTARLAERGHDANALIADGTLTLLDADHTLSLFVRDDRPDRALFFESVGALVEDLTLRAPMKPLRAYGEMVNLLWQAGNAASAIELEDHWNELGLRFSFVLLCAYSMENFGRASEAGGVDEILRLHNHVVPAETYLQAANAGEESREIVRLQQRARALEAEVEERKRLEDALLDSLEEQRAAKDALQESEAQLRDFVENAAEGLHWVAADGTILWANRAELAIVGYERAEYVGRNISEFHRDKVVIDDIMARLGRGEDLRDYESTLVHRDGSERSVVINSNVLWKDGVFVHTRCFTRDVTEQKEAQAALLYAIEEAERANRVKSDLLAVVSHELRTPLNAITGYESLLSQQIGGPITEEQANFLGRIRSASNHLLALIDQVLSLSRLQADKEHVRIESVDLCELMRNAVALIEPGAARKSLEVTLAGADQPIAFDTDAQKVSQILLNLLSNALKFTEAGFIRIVIEQDATTVRVSVSDSGPGINPEDLDRIFEPFVQVDGSSTRRHGGTGLGLTVSRDLAALLDGSLSVASMPGAGSTFTLYLPKTPPTER